MLRREGLIVFVVLLCVACATTTPGVMRPADVDVSGQWVGAWRAAGDTIMRQEMLNAEFVQYGSQGRGKMVWSNANTAALPKDAILAGAIGVPVIMQVSGSTVMVEHALNGRRLAARLEVRGDEMNGRLVGTDAPVELALIRVPEPRVPTTAERLQRLESESANDRARVQQLLAQLSDIQSRADRAGQAAEQATAVAQTASAAAEMATVKVTEALATPVANGNGHAAAATTAEPRAAMTAVTDEDDSRAATVRHERRVHHMVDVTFHFNRADLDETAEAALVDVVDTLKHDPTLNVDLEGYTDSIGSVGYNMQLSQRRVEAVQRFLAKNGVSLSQIHFAGFGPVRDDGSTEEQARNRRVTIKITD